MAIPDYQSVMPPLLRYAADEQEHSVREAIEALADQFQLTDEERKELLPSGRQATFDNRVGWARTYMKKAGLLESPRRSYFRITDRGLQALKTNPGAINNKFIEQYPEFREFKARSNTKGLDAELGAESGTTQVPEQTPREAMENAYDAIRAQLAGELLEQIMSSSPRFFETLVVDLLVNMGYGGTRRDAGEAMGGSGDEGIDGGRSIAFSASGKKHSGIYTIHARGRGKTKVTEGGDDPSCSPDGKKIAYYTGNDLHGEIYTINVGGGGKSKVVTEGANPSWGSRP